MLGGGSFAISSRRWDRGCGAEGGDLVCVALDCTLKLVVVNARCCSQRTLSDDFARILDLVQRTLSIASGESATERGHMPREGGIKVGKHWRTIQLGDRPTSEPSHSSVARVIR